MRLLRSITFNLLYIIFKPFWGADKTCKFIISLNNKLIKMKKEEKVMLLLPSCLQHTECSVNIFDNILNCKKCGRCIISDICSLTNIIAPDKIFVVKGGSRAIELLKQKKPKLIFASACCEELFKGILKVGTQVCAINIETPEGKCFNTTLEVAKLKRILTKVV